MTAASLHILINKAYNEYQAKSRENEQENMFSKEEWKDEMAKKSPQFQNWSSLLTLEVICLRNCASFPFNFSTLLLVRMIKGYDRRQLRDLVHSKVALAEIPLRTWMREWKDIHVPVVNRKPTGIIRMVHHKHSWQYRSQGIDVSGEVTFLEGFDKNI